MSQTDSSAVLEQAASQLGWDRRVALALCDQIGLPPQTVLEPHRYKLGAERAVLAYALHLLARFSDQEIAVIMGLSSTGTVGYLRRTAEGWHQKTAPPTSASATSSDSSLPSRNPSTSTRCSKPCPMPSSETTLNGSDQT